ncbi:MAG TPA: KH domain-containing protein [Clostridia bacterium]|nr:KH domain-containing protein [Clostridia bacterium]
MVELIEYIVKELVEDKENVQVVSIADGGLTTITIKVSQNDTGKIIGKKGKIVTAIRTIAKAVAVKRGEKYIVEVID